MIVCGVFVPQLQHYFTVSFIYAFNCHIKRKLLWQEHDDLRDSSPISSRPWILVGDINQILSQHEHSSIPQTLAPTTGMQEMQSCFEYLDIQDISVRCALYTWKNNCPEKFAWKNACLWKMLFEQQRFSTTPIRPRLLKAVVSKLIWLKPLII
ncbi:unnamed protein product [Arabis nemorensis]|uniref:Endonuclease/exonuclease/phosphatase domain-containing protein n=1 Tax=Arabis nemorensis TaxID=586526 RepID=A0A565AW52_9BRAS|nr:unnamed protein product [Arabis nemorensis]